MTSKRQFTNRLVKEKSPYLLQHAHNPVDWYPWGEEAFAEAKRQDKPIFLSIGYATCHWCHAMEKESFEDVPLAEKMNETFVNIKVDREELPEVDSLYMEFAQAMMAGSAGWPLNLILTPELKPFFAATYLPSHSRGGMMGLSELIERIREVWHSEDRERVTAQAEKVVELFLENVHLRGEQVPDKVQIAKSADLLFKIADPVYGGLKGAPKFPVGYQYEFLLRFAVLNKEGRALFLVDRALEMMSRGGIYDHLGGGFSRYSIDERWIVPHFEKMLYDNALLADIYTNTWKFTKKPLFKEVAIHILDYVLRDMTGGEGEFYSAEDADSEGEEGKFYVFSYDEVKELLDPLEFSYFSPFYGLTQQGNFEGANVLHITRSVEDFAKEIKEDPVEIEQVLARARHKLFEARNLRIHPFKDDKVLTGWNGLMIQALVNTGTAFQMPHFTKAAVKAAAFMKAYLWNREVLFRGIREGELLPQGIIDDYAFMIRGLLALFEAGEGSSYLELAIRLAHAAKRKFKADDGAFFQSSSDEEHLLIRKCQYADGAEPSGNAVHAENLLRLYAITGNQEFLTEAEDILKSVKKFLDLYSAGYFYHTMNLMRYYDKHSPIICVALGDDPVEIDTLKKAIFSHYMPNVSIVWCKKDDELLKSLSPISETAKPIQGKTTLYLCNHNSCQPPISGVDKMVEAIKLL